MNHSNVRCAMFSTIKHENGCVPARIVMWQKEGQDRHPEELKRPFVTHMEVLPVSGQASFAVGHYDMTLDEAKRDFDKRCQQLGVEFESFGK